MALSDTRRFKRVCGMSMPLRAFILSREVFCVSDHKALYRKWRPKTFDDVKGQDGTTDILKYEVNNNKLSHAYLFCGSRGTGKTSCAKILAKAVNCENSRDGNPCNCCDSCRSIDAGIATDVIEMDAASNNGINNVRDMQDEIAFTPAQLKYRVYIIDEVHMMSTQAFNALLKTLEEPPTYVIFILATTEYNKLPTTIVSRCQRFDFRRISNDVIKDRLLEMSRSEGIEITEDAARVIARISRGGMRDAISYLELCAGAHTLIDESLVFDTVGSGNRESTYRLIEAVINSDYNTVYEIINDIVMVSGDLSVFWQEIIDSYRDVMVVKNSDRAKAYLDLTDTEFARLSAIASKISMACMSYHISMLENAMSDMQRAFNSKRSIAEITLTRMCDTKLVNTPEALLMRIEELERTVAMMKLGVPIATSSATAESKPIVETVTETPSEPLSKPTGESVPYSKWGRVIERIGEIKKSLSAGIASASVFKNPDGSFTIRANGFFAAKLAGNEADFAIVRGVLADVEGVSRDNVKIHIQAAEKSAGGTFLELDNALK